ncbi:MAG: choice-of-anchor tandem repeat GloVer-containing protein, partial [Candidatus Sulfotelmatobacter sp.]
MQFPFCLFLLRMFAILFGAAMFSVSVAVAAGPTEIVLHEFSAQQHGAWPVGIVSDSQGNIFGATESGGQYNLGAIFEFSPNPGGGWTETVLHSFAGGSDGSGAYTPVVDAAENVYGVSTGAYGGCNCVYKLARNTQGIWTKTVIYTFQASQGYVNGVLVIDAAGNLYGGLSYYTNGSFSSVFKLAPSGDTWSETTLYTFSAGAVSNSTIVALVVDSNSNVFGTLSETATATQGLLFELTPSSGSWQETTPYTFVGGASGSVPFGPLFLANGNVFGTTSSGGDTTCDPHTGCGVVYELIKGTGGQWTQQVINTFHGPVFDSPSSPTLGGFDSSGNLYGSSLTGGAGGCPQCGSVFQLTPSGSGPWKQTPLWNFTYPGIYYPNAVVVTPQGNVFGTTTTPAGFYYTQGSLFELTPRSPGAWGMSLLYVFPFTDGQWPSSGLVADAAGNLYGTTQYGGTSNLGMVFELSPTATGWKKSTLYNFNSAAGGTYASAGASPLTADGKGNFFGTTELGGVSSLGSVFELSPKPGGGWQEQDLYSFSQNAEPVGGLVFDSAGHMYGVNNIGGANGLGSVFEMTQNSNGTWKETEIYTFAGYPNDGANPYAGLTIDSAGNLYGTTEFGGNGACIRVKNPIGCGTVFELSYAATTGWTETVLYTFEGAYGGDGSAPTARLLFDGSGNIYG